MFKTHALSLVPAVFTQSPDGVLWANDFLTNDIITVRALAVLDNTLNATKSINRQYDDQFRFGGAVLGQTLNIRKPPRYIGRLGQAVQIEGIQETYVPLTLAYQRGIDTQVSSQDLVLNIDEYTERILKPQIVRLANLVNQDVCSLALGLNNQVGTPGVTPTSLDTYWSAKTKLDNGACPSGERTTLLNPKAEQKIGNAVYTNFNPQANISDIYEEGEMGRALGTMFKMDQGVYVHTVGTLGGTPVVDGGNQSGSTITMSGWSGTTLNAGDVLSFGSVNYVNPQTYQDVGERMQFVVTATVTDSAGAITASISPPIIGPGSPLQNVTALPADQAAVRVFEVAAASFATISGQTSPQNMMFNKDFGTLACVDLPKPDGTDKSSRMASRKSGLSLRYIRDYIASTDQWIQRFDILYGVTVLRQELGCRVAG
jgi:hypothetical protein